MPGTVTVGSKLPMPLILRPFRLVEVIRELQGGGTRPFMEAASAGEGVMVNGTSPPAGPDAEPPLIVGGYAMTPGVDADLWAKWLADNKDGDLVKNKLIIAHEKPDSVNGMARDNKDRMTGIEPLDPRKSYGGVERTAA